MEVVDLTEAHKPLYLVCLEDWEDFTDTGDRKERWYEAMARKGLRVQAQNLVAGRARRAAQELGERVVYRELNTLNRDVLAEWGISDALYIDGREVSTGPPPSYDKIKKLVSKRLAKLPR